MQEPSVATTFLFTDIEGSTRLWELESERMPGALARHDAITRSAIGQHHGVVVKMTGDGVHAAFDDPLDAISATLALQRALADPEATSGIAFSVRCGLHAGAFERRDNDFFGGTVNRAARIMSAAHGGQVLLSHTVATLVSERLPPGVALRDLGSVRLRDLAQAEHVYQLTHPRLRMDFPALRSLEATPNNLTQQLTSFVGRQHELADVRRLMAETRLLTLIGAGGIGKTRLSLQVAADAIDDYPDGVWFVELAPLTDAQWVPQAVASVVGVKEEAGRPVQEALIKFVKDRQLLIVLDNCEHLIDACADLARRLLQAGARLKILASSRERMHLSGELTYAVPALSVPDPRRSIAPAALTEYESVRLFVERARAAQPGFRVTEANAPAVADICHRLDGIPLALELAAARVRALAVEKIAERLSDRFRLLAGGDRTALPRQQTLRALIDWSHDLLTAPERAVLRRLAVFAGSWTLEAAEAVAADADTPTADIMNLLSELVEKSLVERDAGSARYRLLDTVRQYALEKLAEAGEDKATRTRHLAFYVAFAENARPELIGADQGVWLARMDLEREDLLLAHAWCDHADGGAELGLRLVFAVKNYWKNRGLLGLGHRLTVEAIGRPGASVRNRARCRALFDAGQLGCFMGNYTEAQPYLEESLAIAREIGDKAMVAMALQPLGMACLGHGDLIAARAHYEEAVALARELGNKRELAAALNALAQMHRVEGKLDSAEPLYQQVVALTRQLGDRESIAIGLLNLAMVAIERRKADDARGMLVEVHTIADEIGSKPVGQSLLEVSAGLAVLRGEWQHVALFWGAGETHMEQTGLRRDAADEAFVAPLIERARAGLGTAAFAAAEAAGRVLSYEEAMATAREWLGDAC